MFREEFLDAKVMKENAPTILPKLHCPPSIASSSPSASPAQLQDHMYSGTSLDIIRLQSFFIIELLPREDEPNLIHLYALLFLQLLLHSQHLLFWFEIEGLLAARERLD